MPQTSLGNVLFRTIVDGAIAIDQHGRILHFNDACERIFGYVPDEVIGENVRMLMPPPYRVEHDDYIANYLRSGDAKIIGIGREVQGLRKDGTIFPMELSVGMAEDTDPPMFVGIVRDISERVESETRLRDSEELFRSVFEVAVDGIIIIDEDGIVESFNPACEDMFGYSPHEVIGENVKVLMPSPFRDEHDGYIDNYLRTGIAKIIGKGREVVGQRKDGSTFPMELSVGHSVTDEKRHFVGIVRNVTERANLQNTLQDQAEKLAQSLQRERTINEMQREFISIATHEFRTPLAVIDASAQRMASILAGSKVAAEAEKRLESIRNNVRRITSLIDSTLDLNRSESEDFALELGTIDAVDVCRAVAMRHNHVSGSDVVSVTTDADTTEIAVDPQLIERLIENLVSNGIKYADGDPRVEIAIESNASNVYVSVRDDGVGIPKEDLSKVFERYYRVRSTSNIPGTGLGLYMCRKYAEMHGGEVTVESKIGEGSTFKLRLPKR